MDLNELLKFMTKKEASDLHIKPMRPPLLRIKGKLIPIKTDPLTPAEINEMVTRILTPAQLEKFERNLAVDIGYGVPGVARFRGNIYMQRGTIGAAFRRIPFGIKSVEELGLPETISEFTRVPQGLVLITGPTGSGKSTTLAAMINDIAQREAYHIITVEDPIEFLFQDSAAAVSQREVGTDTPNFKEALKNAMRQDPDVIMVGEMRDIETISTVITAAETGHLVFSTLHTNTSGQTIDRIIDSFPADQQVQVRAQLALVLRGIVSIRLLQKADGSGMLAAVEILKNSPKIAKHIEAGETKEILEELETSVGYYRMQSMNQSFLALLVNGHITYEQAMELSADPEDLSLKLRKMFPAIEQRARDGAEAKVTVSDLAQIKELMEIKRIYESQEVAFKSQIDAKDASMASLERESRELSQQISVLNDELQMLEKNVRPLRNEMEKIRGAAQVQVNQLNDKIKELNQRMTETGRPGIFKK